jgi:hypothetical protein
LRNRFFNVNCFWLFLCASCKESDCAKCKNCFGAVRHPRLLVFCRVGVADCPTVRALCKVSAAWVRPESILPVRCDEGHSCLFKLYACGMATSWIGNKSPIAAIYSMFISIPPICRHHFECCRLRKTGSHPGLPHQMAPQYPKASG